jgi:hypothetical protein
MKTEQLSAKILSLCFFFHHMYWKKSDSNKEERSTDKLKGYKKIDSLKAQICVSVLYEGVCINELFYYTRKRGSVTCM